MPLAPLRLDLAGLGASRAPKQDAGCPYAHGAWPYCVSLIEQNNAYQGMYAHLSV